MNDDHARLTMQRGVQMRQLAEAPGGLFEIMAAVRVAYLETIVETKADKPADREALYHQIKAHDRIVKAMSDVIREGANAAAMIDALSKKQARKVSNVA